MKRRELSTFYDGKNQSKGEVEYKTVKKTVSSIRLHINHATWINTFDFKIKSPVNCLIVKAIYMGNFY